MIPVKLPLKKLTGRQEELFDIKSRYLVASVGRQFGKSTICQLRLFKRAYPAMGGVYWWVSPTYPQARVIYNRFMSSYKVVISKINQAYLECDLISGARIGFRGADKPDNLRGETLSGVVMDESATIKSNVWPEIIKPMTAVKNAWVDFIGTPKGPNWFRDLYLRAQTEPEWTAFHAHSNESPFFSDAEFEEARRTLPERIFRQEYLAEFLNDDSEVFRGIMDCVRGELEEPVNGRRYVIGCDLAKNVDFTVLVVFDTYNGRNHLVGFERFNQLDWTFQEQRIVDCARKWNNALLVVDSTGVGDPIYDRICRNGVNAIPFKFTTATKDAVILGLSTAIEKRELTFPEIPELLNELRTFSFERLPSGRIRYGAPSGYHDDIVMSLALAVSQLSTMPQNLKIEGLGRTTFSEPD